MAGLDKVKRRLALLLHRHMVAALMDEPPPVPNVLVLGPSGGGKTMVLTTMLNACGAPYAEGNGMEYSPSGYRGRDLPSMYYGLVERRWSGDKGRDEKTWSQREMVQLAQRWGIVLLDEFDKLRSLPGADPEKDFGRPLQSELLKLVEGTKTEVKRSDDDRGFTFDTSRVLHIATGAFQGLERIMLRVDGVEKPTAQEVKEVVVHQEVEAMDIIQYGFLPELVGRFSTIIGLPKLDNHAYLRILNEHTIPQYEEALRSTGNSLVIEPGFLAAIAGQAAKSLVGARGIVPIFEDALWEAWSAAQPGQTVVMSDAMVQQMIAEVRS